MTEIASATVDWANIGGWAAFVVLSIMIVTAFMTGRIYPKSAVSVWKTAAETAWEANDKIAEGLREVLQLSRTTLAVLEKIQEGKEK